MRRLIILPLLLIMFALFQTQSGWAQSDIVISTIEINLWPEFDEPDMLVIYKVTIPAESIKTSLTFSIPKDVDGGKPFEVASLSNDGILVQTPYTYLVGSEWIKVTFVPNSTEFQIEYYDPRLDKIGSSRSFAYTWPGDYTVNSAAIVTQEPLDANHMTLNPPNYTSFMGENGLKYYAHPIGALSKGQNYHFSLSYQKPTNTLTNDKLDVRSVGNLPGSMWNRGLPWALGALALILIAGGMWVYWRSGLPQAAGQKKRTRRKAVSPAGGETAEDNSVYCHSCGRRASTGDVFCRSCGTKLRI
jgi:hypothetical protein